MKIWLINPFSDLPGEGASEGRFCYLARVMAEQGHEVTWWTVDFHHRKKAKRSRAPERSSSLLVPGASFGAVEVVDEEGTKNKEKGTLKIVLLPIPEYRKNISFARLKSHRAYGLEFAKAAAERIEADPSAVPDVIHLSSPPLDCIEPALALKKQYGCRVTVDVMDLWPETFYRTLPRGLSLLGKLLFAPLHRKAHRAYREADGVSAVSQEYLELVAVVREQGAGSREQRTGAMPEDLHLCYVGGELIEPVTSYPESRISDPASHPTFLYVGAMTPTYDLETVVAAAANLKDQGLGFELWFAGSGVSEAALKIQVERLGLADAVRFYGFLDQEALADVLREADVGLNAIKLGTFITMPHKLSDYLCAGLAVINSIPGEADDLLRRHNTGSFYEAGNIDSLFNAMRSYIISPEMLISQKEAALELAKESFDRSKTYSAFAKWITGNLS